SALLTVLILGFAAQPAAAQDNISGVWAADLSMGDGNILRAYLDLKQSGDQITGAFWYAISRRPISKGTVANGKFHIEFILWQDTPPPIGICDGVVQGDKLRLTVNLLQDVVATGPNPRVGGCLCRPTKGAGRARPVNRGGGGWGEVAEYCKIFHPRGGKIAGFFPLCAKFPSLRPPPRPCCSNWIPSRLKKP